MEISLTIKKVIERTMEVDYMPVRELKERLIASGFDMTNMRTYVVHAGDNQPLVPMADDLLLTYGDHIYFIAVDAYDAVKELEEQRYKELLEECDEYFE